MSTRIELGARPAADDVASGPISGVGTTGPDRIDLNRAAIFVKIVEAGGVTAAAAKLRLPKSSVSRALTQLESELRVELVSRSARRFELTSAGRAFFESAAKGVAALEEARDQVLRHTVAPRGLVRVAAEPMLAIWLLAPIIARFVREYPDVEVELSATGGNVDLVRDGFDIVLTSGKQPDSSAVARSFGRLHGAVFASSTYLRERGTPKRPADLAKHECILYRAESKKASWTLVPLAAPSNETTVAVSGRLRVDDLATAMAAASAHGGLVVLPLGSPPPGGPADSLVRVLPAHFVVGEPASLVRPASRHTPLQVELLLDAIVEVASRTCQSH